MSLASRVVLVVAWLTLVAVAAASPGSAAPIGLKARIGVDYTRGDYDEDEDTTTIEVPVGLEATWQRYRLAVRSGFVHNDGPVIAGVPGAARNPRAGGPRAPDSGAASGVSDLRVLGGVLLTMPPARSPMPWIELQGEVKIAVADEAEGLGTGENDYRVALDVSKRYGDVTPFATGGYRFRGDPSGADASALNDGAFVSVGALYRVVEAFSVGAAVDWSESPTDGLDDPVEVSPFASIALGDRFSLGPYLSFGLTEGAPDYGGGVQLTIRLLREGEPAPPTPSPRIGESPSGP